MPKVLFVGAHRANRSPSQRFRFEQYFSYLESKGYKCDLLPLLTEKEDRTFYSSGNYLNKGRVVWSAYQRRKNDLAQARNYDLIFIQREAFMTGTTFFERGFARSGKKIIFDFDDAIWLPNVSAGNKRFLWLKNPSKTDKILQLADLVIAGNNFLADYAKKFNERVEVIPTTIDTAYHKRNTTHKNNERICIGWTGSPTTTPHFELALPALHQLKKKFGDRIYFKLIGNPGYQNEELSITGVPWNPDTEIEDLCELDIGLMPLPDTDWARGKCGLKALQYMALEIPCVMSAVGVNKEIVKHGEDGYLVSTEQDWVDRLSRLIENRELCKTIGTKARQTVEDRFSVNAQRDRYLILFEQLLG